MYQATQKYIPGLTQRPPDPPNQKNTSETNKLSAKEIPPELIKAFKDGSKHPVSALNEYCALQRIVVSFREAFALTGIGFASVCTVDGKDYPQGMGNTKKDAKTAAAKNALNAILGIAMDEEEDDDDGTVEYDSMGRKMTYSQGRVVFQMTSAFQQSQFKSAIEDKKSPINKLQEYCAKKLLPFKIEVGDVAGPMGFDAYVLVNGDIVAEGFANNKKEAKRLAAIEALENLMTTDVVRWPNKKKVIYEYGTGGRFEVELCDPVKVRGDPGNLKLHIWGTGNKLGDEASADTPKSSEAENSDTALTEKVGTANDRNAKRRDDMHALAGNDIMEFDISRPKEKKDKSINAQWSFQSDDDQWIHYPADLNLKVEKAYGRNSTGSTIIELDGKIYKISFLNMTQECNKTGESNRIKRNAIINMD